VNRVKGPPSAADRLFARAFAGACELDAAGDDEGARRAYLALLRADPNHFGALTNLAALLSKRGNRSAARALLTQAASVAPDDPIAHVNLALSLFDDDAGLARAHYEKALRLDPENREAHRGLAVILLRQGEEDAARVHASIGFRGAAQAWPYRGTGTPPSILMLISAMGNIAIDRLIDDHVFQKWTLVVEFYDPRVELPAHDVVLNCVGDADLARGEAAFAAVDQVLARSHARVINPPSPIRATGRVENARRLREVPGVVTPDTALWSRASLAASDAPEALAGSGFAWPLLLRSPGFHTGHHFVKVDAPAALGSAIASLPGAELLVMQFADTRSADGFFRKYRVMFIGGELYPLHLAVSPSWKVHYFSADMAESTEHRAEEDAFLRDMPGALGSRVVEALRRIDALLGLDYGGIDFAIGAGGSVVVFEANASMLIAPVGDDARWAYRAPAVARAMDATRRLLLGA
jgi:hypothetical protein